MLILKFIAFAALQSPPAELPYQGLPPGTEYHNTAFNHQTGCYTESATLPNGAEWVMTKCPSERALAITHGPVR